ncbi:MAG TPA: hypothetical protein VN180_11700 [Acidimicrobiia bacterium]|nr:hypothetical protein [Acidimicrobiia bacterium]
MDPLEVQLDAFRVVMFDGHVLEIFGGADQRFHVKLLTVSVAAPDKKGQRRVALEQSQRETDLLLDENAFARLEPILDALRTAGVAFHG